MAESLHLSSSDYSLAVSIFFIGYLLLEVPSNMILNRTRPSLYLPGLMVCSEQISPIMNCRTLTRAE